ncbi:MAG: 3-hydroxybutyrate dehydrogenase, partial [Planctomycetes bacterium]|nr:3-hydroxybutyrate dehydrogenase [Planctomycetota bacterium]
MNPKAQTILISGAGSGVGRGLSLRFAKQGLHVYATDLKLDAARETVQQLEREGGKATALEMDVAKEASVAQAFEKIPGQRVDVLVNNAGIQFVAAVDEFPAEKWRQLTEVLLDGPYLLTRAVLPGMKQRNFGRIVNIGSIHSLVASPFKSAYVAAKHGLLGLAKTVALETGGHDITVNTICPSYIKTPLVDAQIASQAKLNGISEQEVIDKIMLQPMPKKAFITIDEIAATVDFLLSDGARNITGQSIAIDGGWTAR